jgi:thiol-disulfide isomerase/thioredoxin
MRHWTKVGLLVLLAGAGALWLAPEPGQGSPLIGESAPTLVLPDLSGREFSLAALRGKAVALNFWATWCPPCIKEMPQLDRFQREFAARGWQVLGLAVDRPQPVRDFLVRTPVGYTIAMAGFEGSELTRQLGNSAGGLPFTVVLARDGRIIHRKLGETSFDELARFAATT